jgi:Arc/MetJ family transcription regulator
MRTTVDIDDAMMAEVMRSTGLRTKKEVIHRALELLAGLAAQQELRALFGSTPAIREAPRRRFEP